MKTVSSRIYPAAWLVVLSLFLLSGFEAATARAGMREPPPQKIDAIIVGDKVVDIAYNLGVLPRAMSVRGSLWEMAPKLRVSSQILGCPMFTTVRNKQTIPEALKRYGVNRVIVGKTDVFCLYKPEVKPESIAEILKDADVTIEYVDFTKGLESAVREVARLTGREDRVEALLAKYRKDLAEARERMPKNSGKKVLILNGIFQQSTGKVSLRVEAPGLYSDRFFLDPMGCTNVGDVFKPADGSMVKGYYPVRKKKGGLVLDPLLKANPDIIVITGNAWAVQKALADFMKANPALADVPAIKKQAIFHLPLYVDSSVLEFPKILLQWALALE